MKRRDLVADLNIFFARNSWISLWRGAGADLPLFG